MKKTIVAALSLFVFPLLSHTDVVKGYYYHEDNQVAYDDEDSNDDQYTSDDEQYTDQNPIHFTQLASNSGKKLFIFDPTQLRWFAYGPSGNLVASGRASGGRNYCPDIGRRCHTPVGTFHVTGKGGPGCVSSKFPVGEGGAPMPWCMYFHGGFAIHGSYEVRNYNASHGCIRIEPSDAKWLSQEFMDIGTTVIVRPY